MKELRAVKTQVGKVIQWSSSKFNDMKKSDVVHDICDTANRARDLEGYSREYRCGSYSPRGSLCGGSYDIIVKDGVAILTNDTTGEKYVLIPKDAQ